MGSRHFSNHTIAFRAFKNKLCARNLKECVVKSVPTYFDVPLSGTGLVERILGCRVWVTVFGG